MRPAVNSLARISLLVVAVIVAGMSLGFAPARADDLPEDANKIECLTPEHARKLAEEFPGVEVGIKIKGRQNFMLRRCLPLNGLKSLDAETAKALAGYDKGPLLLNGLTTLDPDIAKALTEFTGELLSLDGLTTLDADTAKALAECKGKRLVLNALTTLDTDTAKAIAEFKGWLSLDGLTMLDFETAKALADCEGRLYLNGLTTLDADTAKAIAGSKAWNGVLPELTTLDTRDSVSIAKAFATRKGPLSLPGLKKISPKTLTALIKKQDVEIPPIETLELIQEPDGSLTEDFVIPEWLEARQKQQRVGRGQ
jgi:hypothetical protein